MPIRETLARLFSSPAHKLEQILRQTGDVEELARLLQRHRKLEVNRIIFKGGFSALQLCSLHGHADCVRHLITQTGADCNHVNPLDNSTALHVGACGGSLAVVKALIELGGANVNCLTEVGFTPLHYAVLGGKREVYVYMISTGRVDCSARNSEGVSPLLLAARAGQIDAVRYLIEFAAINIQEADGVGCSALHYACASGNEALVTYLLSAGACVTAKDSKNRTPGDLNKKSSIQALLMSPSPSEVASLAETSSADASSFSAVNEHSRRRVKRVVDPVIATIEAACRTGDVRELTAILSRRPDAVDLKLTGGWSCLHICAQQGRAACIEVLLSRTKLQADMGNEMNGVTALHLAAKFNHISVLKVLVDKFRANTNVRTFKGRTPLHFAVLHGDKALCAYLLANKADHYAQDRHGVTVLMAAALRGNADIASLLIQSGADLEVKDVRGRTALHVAYAKGHYSLTALLIQAGADETARNRRGETPLESMRERAARAMPAAGGFSSRVPASSALMAAEPRSAFGAMKTSLSPSLSQRFSGNSLQVRKGESDIKIAGSPLSYSAHDLDESDDDEFDGWVDAGPVRADQSDSDDDDEEDEGDLAIEGKKTAHKKTNDSFTV